MIDLARNRETLPRLVSLQRIHQNRAALAVDVTEIEVPLPEFLLHLAHRFIRAGRTRKGQRD